MRGDVAPVGSGDPSGSRDRKIYGLCLGVIILSWSALRCRLNRAEPPFDGGRKPVELTFVICRRRAVHRIRVMETADRTDEKPRRRPSNKRNSIAASASRHEGPRTIARRQGSTGLDWKSDNSIAGRRKTQPSAAPRKLRSFRHTAGNRTAAPDPFHADTTQPAAQHSNDRIPNDHRIFTALNQDGISGSISNRGAHGKRSDSAWAVLKKIQRMRLGRVGYYMSRSAIWSVSAPASSLLLIEADAAKPENNREHIEEAFANSCCKRTGSAVLFLKTSPTLALQGLEMRAEFLITKINDPTG